MILHVVELLRAWYEAELLWGTLLYNQRHFLLTPLKGSALPEAVALAAV